MSFMRLEEEENCQGICTKFPVRIDVKKSQIDTPTCMERAKHKSNEQIKLINYFLCTIMVIELVISTIYIIYKEN